MKCPICDGQGGWSEDFGEGTILFEGCNQCNQSGKISLREYISLWFWMNVPVWFVEWFID